MKKLLLILSLGFGSMVSAQVLQSDNFDALTVGNVGTDITGATAGQGSWFTQTNNGAAPTTSTNAANTNFQIVTTGNNTTNGLKIIAPDGNKGNRFLWKSGLDLAWAARDAGSNIIEVEYDFYTGDASTSTDQVGARLYDATFNVLNGFVYTKSTKILTGVCYLNNAGTPGTYLITLQTGGLILTDNTWYRLGFSYDTTTGHPVWKVGGTAVYTGLPAANWAGPTDPSELDFVSAVPSTPANAVVSDVTIDNYDVKAVPTESLLGVSQVAINNSNLSIYPNPATNVVNVSGKQIAISNIQLTDLNGRVVKSVNLSNVSDAQVNISDLSTGVYMMKIVSDQGTTTKKVIKE